MNAHSFSQLDAVDPLLTIDQVRQIVPKSARTIYRWAEAGRFPASHKIGANSSVWLLSEVMAWVKQKTAAAS